MKILIVEDEPSLREIMYRALVQEHYVVETAATYADADAKVAGYSYDCILLDIMLPDGNGLRLLEHIKELRKRENVIIISARNSLEDKVLGLEQAPTTTCPNRSTRPNCWRVYAACCGAAAAAGICRSRWATYRSGRRAGAWRWRDASWRC